MEEGISRSSFFRSAINFAHGASQTQKQKETDLLTFAIDVYKAIEIFIMILSKSFLMMFLVSALATVDVHGQAFPNIGTHAVPTESPIDPADPTDAPTPAPLLTNEEFRSYIDGDWEVWYDDATEADHTCSCEPGPEGSDENRFRISCYGEE
jgi:hypothetical protein